MIIPLGRFFIFSKFCFFLLLGVKKGKMVQNDRICPLHLISQDPYIIWLSFMVHMYKIKSPGVFLIFQVVSRLKGQKMVQNDKKFCSSRFISQEPYIIWFSFLVHSLVWNNISRFFFQLFTILVFQVVKGVKGQKTLENDKNCIFFILLKMNT